MLQQFETYLRTKTDLPLETIGRICSLAVQRNLKRNEFLLTAGEICRCKTFVASGMLRTYSISADGSEHILQFSPENSWTLDPESYDNNIPSLVNIAAVEHTSILCWQRADFLSLLAEIPQFKIFSEKIISQNIYYSRQRILKAISSTPEEKYEDFVREFPGYLSRLPLRMMAAYLGISLKTLTRIRHAQLVRH